MDNMTIFDFMYPTFKIDKPIRLIETFAGVGSQAMALRDIGANFEHYKIVEWEVNAFASYKAIHMSDDTADYSADYDKKQLIEILSRKGISNDGKNPMTKKQISGKNEIWLRTVYNNIKATHNLVDMTKVNGKDLNIIDTDKYIYIYTYSFPCQDLSVAGKMKGMKKGSGTRSGMLWEVERQLDELEELPQILLMENVPQVISDQNIADFRLWQDFLESKGYTNYVDTLNAKDYEVAQNRERTFMISLLGQWNFKFPQPIPLTKTMADYLENEVDEKYYINSEKAKNLIKQLIDSGQIQRTDQYNINVIGSLNPQKECQDRVRVLGTDGICQSIRATDYKDPPKICSDLSINNHKVTEISNCITARQDRGISNQRSVGGSN